MRLIPTWIGKPILLAFFALMVLSRCPGNAIAQEAEAEPILDGYTVLVVCAAAHIVAEDAPGALWFSTIVEDEEQVSYFVNLFIDGLEAEDITVDDIADTIEACGAIRAKVDAME